MHPGFRDWGGGGWHRPSKVGAIKLKKKLHTFFLPAYSAEVICLTDQASLNHGD